MTLNLKVKKVILIIFSSLLILACFTGCTIIDNLNKFTTTGDIVSDDNSEGITVHFIDVGQADSILIQQGGAAMLIDGGNNTDGEFVKEYIGRQNITQLDYIIATHPHEDHIGGLDYIINSFNIGKVYHPRQTTTTETFKDFISAVKENGLSLSVPTVGEQFKLGEALVTVLAPNSSNYQDLNDYSIVLKVTFKNTTFLFTGDAEAVSENEMLKNDLDLKADVLKVGHHGSKSSTSSTFLNAVKPKYAVISVGEGNKYGHPGDSILERLENAGVKTYRTDINGTIIAKSDGRVITIVCDK